MLSTLDEVESFRTPYAHPSRGHLPPKLAHTRSPAPAVPHNLLDPPPSSFLYCYRSDFVADVELVSKVVFAAVAEFAVVVVPQYIPTIPSVR